jgi:hypothetical protein
VAGSQVSGDRGSADGPGTSGRDRAESSSTGHQQQQLQQQQQREEQQQQREEQQQARQQSHSWEEGTGGGGSEDDGGGAPPSPQAPLISFLRPPIAAGGRGLAGIEAPPSFLQGSRSALSTGQPSGTLLRQGPDGRGGVVRHPAPLAGAKRPPGGAGSWLPSKAPRRKAGDQGKGGGQQLKLSSFFAGGGGGGGSRVAR